MECHKASVTMSSINTELCYVEGQKRFGNSFLGQWHTTEQFSRLL